LYAIYKFLSSFDSKDTDCRKPSGAVLAKTITLAGIACIIMREVYATIGESIYPNPSFLSRDFPEASGRLLRNLKRVHVSRYG